MTCKHQFQMLPGQDLYQWCPNCGSIFDIKKNKGQSPRLLDVTELKHIELNNLEKAHCRDNNKIMAIKLLRERTGLGLYETKCIVDAYLDKHPPKRAFYTHCSECGEEFNRDCVQVPDKNYCYNCQAGC